MISTPDRQATTLLIQEAVTAGARRSNACAELQISERTLRFRGRGLLLMTILAVSMFPQIAVLAGLSLTIR